MGEGVGKITTPKPVITGTDKDGKPLTYDPTKPPLTNGNWKALNPTNQFIDG